MIFTLCCDIFDQAWSFLKYWQNVNFDFTIIFWGELIDKYKDINANSKTVFTDYTVLKLVLYSPHMFLLFCQSEVGVVKKFLLTLVSPTQKTGT